MRDAFRQVLQQALQLLVIAVVTVVNFGASYEYRETLPRWITEPASTPVTSTLTPIAPAGRLQAVSVPE